MSEVNILGVPVEFPFDPYPTQLLYMEKVVLALRGGSNGLLESPTGTGKTLCLLCASLGWLRAYKAALQARPGSQLHAELAPKVGLHNSSVSAIDSVAAILGAPGQQAKDRALPRIVYSSRTHGQLTQVIRELAKTSYRPKVSVLASREHLCVHDEIKRLRGPAQVSACRALVANRHCSHKLQTDKQTRELVHAVHAEPRDIEDLAKVVSASAACPFFVAREAQLDAELVLIPYHYVIDSATRESMAIDMVNDILILDEGHNLLEACSNQWSFDLAPDTLTACSTTILAAAEVLEASTTTKGFNQAISAVNQPVTSAVDASTLRRLAEHFALLRKQLEQIERPAEGSKDVGPFGAGRFLNLLADAGFDTDSFPAVKRALDTAATEVSSSRSTTHVSITGLRLISDALRSILGPGSTRQVVEQDFVFVVHPKGSGAEGSAGNQVTQHVRRKSTSWFSPQQSATPANLSTKQNSGPLLSAWCMNPGLAMQDILNAGTRSILLTSGTLSPMASFASEMRIPFNVTLENSHVITSDQVAVGVVRKGPTGIPLSSSYKTRDSDDYKKDLGRALANMSKVLPGGLLVFFPSYAVLKKAVEFWKSERSGTPTIWSQLQKSKRAVVESQDGAALNQLLEAHERNILDHGGGCLLAVCRGRVSEGIDFSDERGRTVVITGLPYASVVDPRIKLKKLYMDKNRMTLKMSGAEWYSIQAIRAVNQAVGRIIRHRNDYGAVILADERFSQDIHSGMLSRWLRPHIKIFEGYGEAHGHFARFFKQAAALPFAQIKSVPVRTPRTVDPDAERQAKKLVADLVPKKHGLDEKTSRRLEDIKQPRGGEKSPMRATAGGNVPAQSALSTGLGKAIATVPTDTRGSLRGPEHGERQIGVRSGGRSKKKTSEYMSAISVRLGPLFSDFRQQLKALKELRNTVGDAGGVIGGDAHGKLQSICEHLVRAFFKSAERLPMPGEAMDPLLAGKKASTGFLCAPKRYLLASERQRVVGVAEFSQFVPHDLSALYERLLDAAAARRAQANAVQASKAAKDGQVTKAAGSAN